jgi:hypothetical protein
MALGSTKPLTNEYHEYFRPVRRTDNLATFRNPQGLSRPVMGLLYLYFTTVRVTLNSATENCNKITKYGKDFRSYLLYAIMVSGNWMYGLLHIKP